MTNPVKIFRFCVRKIKIYIKKIKFNTLRKKNIFIDATSNIDAKCKLDTRYGGSIKIGKNNNIRDYVLIQSYGGNIDIGNNISINPFSVIYGHGNVKIGNNVMIATHTVIIPANHIFDDIETPIYLQGETTKGIIIEDDVWIATGCRILDGVTIGKGSVIGAGSVVTKSVPEYSVVAGVPAKVLRKRGSKKQ